MENQEIVIVVAPSGSTFREMMKENGYECMTTFWDDFSIADRFGANAVKDTFRRAFNEWKDNVEYATELSLVLYHKIHQHFTRNKKLALLYDEIWRDLVDYVYDNWCEEDLSYYYRITD